MADRIVLALFIAAGSLLLLRRLRRRLSLPIIAAPAPAAFEGDTLTTPASTFYLGDVFSDVAPDGYLEWDARPLPGRTVRLLLASDGSLQPRIASASVRPFADGPFGDGHPVEAWLGNYPFEGDTSHHSVDVVLPQQPGWYWLQVRVDSHGFGPLRIEVADPALLEARAKAFALADRALQDSDDAGPWLVSGLYAPRAAGEIRLLLPEGEAFAGDGGVAWPLMATRVDADGVLQPQQDKPLNRWIFADPKNAAATLHDDVALASWTMYNWPQRAPRGGYAGWWWKRDGLPAGGLCGTAWCQYPFPGNVPRAWAPTLAIATPPPPDPLDWWLARRGGWICGNGWWQGRQGPGGLRFGPWWPLDEQGLPAPHTGPGGPGDPPQPPPAPSAGGTRTRRRPPGLQPPPATTACAADFVEAVSMYTYGKPPYGRRIRAGGGVHGIARYDRLPSYTGDLRWVCLARGWTESEVSDELRRNRDWWAQYCISVTDRELILPDDEALRRLDDDYRRWLNDLPQPPPGVMMGLGDEMTTRGLQLLSRTIELAQAAIRRSAGGSLLVLFMPRVLGKTGHTADNEARPTEASFTVPGQPIVVLNQLDADDDYILTHELIHAWGRPASFAPGEICWDHKSGHPRAMSRIIRTHIKQPAGLGADRLLDYAEYDEILSSRSLKPAG